MGVLTKRKVITVLVIAEMLEEDALQMSRKGKTRQWIRDEKEPHHFVQIFSF